MNIKQESDDMRHETHARHAKAQEQFEQFQHDVEAKMTVIVDTLTLLREGMQESNAVIETRMSRQGSAIINLTASSTKCSLLLSSAGGRRTMDITEMP